MQAAEFMMGSLCFPINLTVYLQCSESLQPVALRLWTAFVSGVQTQSKKWDTGHVFHGRALRSHSEIAETSSQRCEAWKIGRGMISPLNSQATYLLSLTFVVWKVETTSRPKSPPHPAFNLLLSRVETEGELLSNAAVNVFNT